MSCWRRTTVLRIPAICLGFVCWEEWERFLNEHDDEFDWSPGHFASALCDSYDLDAYAGRLPNGRGCGPGDRLDMDLYPDEVSSVPGPFLDYCLAEIAPLPDEENTYHENDCARPLTPEEKKRYLPLYRGLFPAFAPEKMDDVHYCRYEWYDGSEAYYLY